MGVDLTKLITVTTDGVPVMIEKKRCCGFARKAYY